MVSGSYRSDKVEVAYLARTSSTDCAAASTAATFFASPVSRTGLHSGSVLSSW